MGACLEEHSFLFFLPVSPQTWILEPGFCYGCHISCCRPVFTTEQQPRLKDCRVSPSKPMIEDFHSGGSEGIDAKLCQHSVAAPFPQTVYLVKSIHNSGSWQSGPHWSKARCVRVFVCVLLVQATVIRSWQWSCFSTSRQKEAMSSKMAIISNKLNKQQFKLFLSSLYSHNRGMHLSV